MVDAQCAAVAAVLADGFGKQPVSVFPMVFGMGRWEPPVLAFRREVVRGGTHPAARHEELAVRPEIRAEPISGERQIVV